MARPLPALLKHIGRGARLAKDLDAEEAEALMRAVAAGEADAYQVGGFLYAMRMKGESAAELAGFVRALRGFVDAPPPEGVHVDVDLHADGREGRPSLSPAAACIAAACGARVLLRGWFANRFSRNDLGEVFARLGIGGGDLDAGVAVIDLERAAPRVAALLALRERLGVRSCVHSAVKLLDPAGCRRAMIGIFHGPYHAPVAGAAALLGAERAAVVQAAGGLPELSPDKPTRVSRVEGGVAPAGPETLGPFDGAPLETAESAGALAELIEAVVAGRGPPGATRSAVVTAGLMLWTAGLVDDLPAGVSRADAALAGGGAARVLARLRV